MTFHPVGPLYPDGLNPNAPFDDDIWELYHVEVDVSESKNLAEAHPERLRDMIDLWWVEAERNQVLPLDNRILWALVNPKPDARRERDRFRYFQDGAQVPEPVAVNVRNRSHALIVDITVPEETTPEGTLLAIGSGLGGWSCSSGPAARVTFTICTGRSSTSSAQTTSSALAPTPLSTSSPRTKDWVDPGPYAVTGRRWPRARSTDSRPRHSTGWALVSPVAMNGDRPSGTATPHPTVSTAPSNEPWWRLGTRLRDPMAEIEAILAEQ